MDRWRSLAKELVCTPAITVNQSARLPNAAGKPRLVVFSDGSSVAYIAVIYMVFGVSQNMAGPWSSGLGCKESFKARLLLSKAQVAPLSGMTVTQTEMNALML